MARQNDPVLKISDLSVALPQSGERRFAVQDVNLSVSAGEILCVVGESGSGKSVTAFASMGLLPRALQVTAGSIHLGSQDLLRLSERAHRNVRGAKMSMVFQEPMSALNPAYTIGNQIAEIFTRHRPEMRASERKAKVRDMLEMVHMPTPDQIVNAYPGQLSGGQRQRVMIAMAMALSPKLLIADEPTTALDVTTQAHILELIRQLRDQHGMAVIMITHDFGVVSDIADRVAVMEKGLVVEEGATAEILNNPSHQYTKRLIAAIPRMRTRRSKGKKAPERALSEQPILSVKNLQKTYITRQGIFGHRRVVKALKPATFDIGRGDAIAIVGESGSGKSTLVNCMMRLVDASGGNMMLNDADFLQAKGEALRAQRRDMQIVFQDPYSSLNPRKTIREALLQGSRNFAIPLEAAELHARSLLSMVKMDVAALDRLPNQFSGGQRQRICIARALMLKPKILIADEAVSALDVSVQAEVLQLLSSIRKQMRLTLLFVTHDLRVASQVCEKVMVMQQGDIVETGDIVDVFVRPQHPYTKTLLEALPGKGFL